MRTAIPRVPAAALGTAVAAAAAVLGPLAGPAGAHERRQVAHLQLVTGWAQEPTYTGSLNAVQLRINDVSGGEAVPVTDIGDSLKVEVSFGEEKVGPLDLHSVFGSPGEYQAPLIPTRPGVYTFRFVGTVNGQAIDESFTSSDTTFDSPQEAQALEFPAQDPTRAELGDRVERLDLRLGEAAQAVDDADGSASLALVLAVVALVVGVAGVLVGVTARRGARA